MFHVLYVLVYGQTNFVVQVSVAAQKPWLEFLGNAQHIVQYQYLAINIGTCTNTDYRDLN